MGGFLKKNLGPHINSNFKPHYPTQILNLILIIFGSCLLFVCTNLAHFGDSLQSKKNKLNFANSKKELFLVHVQVGDGRSL